jgi:hypothetical protein
MAAPKVGAAYRYRGDAGLAARARIADPDVGDDLPAEMHDLDMQPDTVVEVTGYDAERDLVLVGWTDLQGNPRITSVTPGDFADDFEEC